MDIINGRSVDTQRSFKLFSKHRGEFNEHQMGFGAIQRAGNDDGECIFEDMDKLEDILKTMKQ